MTERYHALLVGIDDYRTGCNPLNGCVNDIDHVQAILLDRLGLLPGDITRLDAPLPGTRPDARVPRQDATLANLQAALDRLASAAVAPGDRVFIYYAGHGGRQAVPGGDRTTWREALMPVADGAYQLMWDDEVNRRLAAIAARTRAVSVVLDCCFGAGVTRSGATQVRGVELPPSPTTRGGPSTPVGRGLRDCHIVAACLAHQGSAWRIDEHGAFGVFSRAFAQAIGDTLRDPHQLTWAEIWQPMRGRIQRIVGDQVPWMEGSAACPVFGGPPVDRDPGIAVHHERGAYQLAAGALADVTPGTVLGVYRASPAMFPGLGSDDDDRARIGELVVTTAELGTAEAQPRGAAFHLPLDARARIIQAGSHARLRYALDPADRAPAAMRDALARSPLLAHDANAAVRLVHHADRWFVTDELHGTGDAGDGRPALVAIPDAVAHLAHRVLEQYISYARPIALASRLAGAGQNQVGGLALEVKRWQPGRTGDAPLRSGMAEAHGGLPTFAPSSPDTYALAAGEPIVFVVENTTAQTLRVSLFNAAASGRVLLLGDQTIQPRHHLVFWRDSTVDRPFPIHPPSDRHDAWIERVIALGRTQQGDDLKHLVSRRMWRDALADGATEPSRDPPSRSGSAERWTATQAILTVRRR